MPILMFSSIFASSQQLLECVVELAAECRDEGMGAAEFVSTVAYRRSALSKSAQPRSVIGVLVKLRCVSFCNLAISLTPASVKEVKAEVGRDGGLSTWASPSLIQPRRSC
jgi:hypothetical protein